ncbi:MAG: hypothetical protein R3358_08155 [Woeseiaceae bacterium]|nr:hypothetical protein [Woeseiaceae bacterium]
MTRTCPNCGNATIPVREVLFADYVCPSCKRMVGVTGAASFVFAVLIFVTTLVTTFIIFLQFDVYAAILWFSLPIGALSYIKARYCPLQRKNR